MIFVFNRQTQLLPPLNYVYYTWTDPLKPRDLLISCGTKSATIQLTVSDFVGARFPSLQKTLS
jgi:hypothetical protein